MTDKTQESISPYIKKAPGDLMLASDWNDLQTKIKEEFVVKEKAFTESLDSKYKELVLKLSALEKLLKDKEASLNESSSNSLQVLENKLKEEDTKVSSIAHDELLKRVPKGVIVMWSGEETPDGWALCDGSYSEEYNDYLPDLRNRFIVGSGNDYSLNETGGEKSVTLTVDQMPAHSHSGTANETDIVNRGNNSGKEYKLLPPSSYKRGFDGGDHTGYDVKGEEVKSLSWCINFSHSHELTINNSGEGKAHENRPPYYALAFIIKI